MASQSCKAKSASGTQCKRKPNESGYCHLHDPSKAEEKAKQDQRVKRFGEVVNSVIQTAEAKGWTANLENKDNKTWKYASVGVKRYTGSNWVEANFDITIGNGVKISTNILTPFNSHGVSDLRDAILDELRNLPWLSSSKKTTQQDIPALTKVIHLLKRFHRVARQLHHRHDDRETLVIRDEYDVQDLLHALLCQHFDDIRPEDPTPSKAGASSRVDFLLKKEKIVVEVKMTTQTLRDKKVGEELIIDIKRYQAHPDCDTLVCFVYDPDGFLKNSVGLVEDISRKHDGLDVKLIVVPTH